MGPSNHSKSKLRPPVPRYGGKYFTCRRIIEEFPDHQCYLEAFGGGGSVLLNKVPSPAEAYNDLDLQVTRIFRALRNHGEEFTRRLQLIPYSEVEFKQATVSEGSEMDRAIAGFIRLRQSFAATGRSWRFSRRSSAGGMAKVVNHWCTAIDALPEIIDRLKKVQITSQPAVKSINRFDHAETLIYCDPPYLHGTRATGSDTVYDYEMTDDDHRKLARVLNRCKSQVVLSGYPSNLYDELYPDWRTKQFNVVKHEPGRVERRTASG